MINKIENKEKKTIRRLAFVNNLFENTHLYKD